MLDLSFGPDGRQVAAVVGASRRHDWSGSGTWLVAKPSSRPIIRAARSGQFNTMQRSRSARMANASPQRCRRRRRLGNRHGAADLSWADRHTDRQSAPQANGCDPEVRRWAFLEMFGSRGDLPSPRYGNGSRPVPHRGGDPDESLSVRPRLEPGRPPPCCGFQPGQRVRVQPAERSERAAHREHRTRLILRVESRREAVRLLAQGEVRLGSVTATERPSRLGEPLRLPGVVSLSPDGTRLAWGGPKPGVWNVASGRRNFPWPGTAQPWATWRGPRRLLMAAMLLASVISCGKYACEVKVRTSAGPSSARSGRGDPRLSDVLCPSVTGWSSREFVCRMARGPITNV